MSANESSKMINKLNAELEDIKDRLTQAGDQVRSTVEKNPIAVLCAALGAGFIAGFLLRRR
ncbi:MAG: hypothetical protein R3E60_03345 [Alphaproteobacteria bacterium]